MPQRFATSRSMSVEIYEIPYNRCASLWIVPINAHSAKHLDVVRVLVYRSTPIDRILTGKLYERRSVERFCSGDVVIRSGHAEVNAFLIEAYDAFAIGTRA